MTFDLISLVKAANDSWAAAYGTVHELRAAAARQGWTEISMRSTSNDRNLWRALGEVT